MSSMTSEGWAVIRWNGKEEDVMRIGELRGPFLTEEAALAFARSTVFDREDAHGVRWERASVVPIGKPVVMIWESENDTEDDDASQP